MEAGGGSTGPCPGGADGAEGTDGAQGAKAGGTAQTEVEMSAIW